MNDKKNSKPIDLDSLLGETNPKELEESLQSEREDNFQRYKREGLRDFSSDEIDGLIAYCSEFHPKDLESLKRAILEKE